MLLDDCPPPFHTGLRWLLILKKKAQCKYLDKVYWAYDTLPFAPALNSVLRIVRYKCFSLESGFPQNTIAKAKTCISKRFVGQWVGSLLILCQFNMVPAQSVQSLLLLWWWSSITELPDWPIRQGMTGQHFLLINCHIFISLPLIRQIGKFPQIHL